MSTINLLRRPLCGRSAAIERAAVPAIIDNIPASIAIHNESGELVFENRAALDIPRPQR